jgi:hypothetical protein
MLEDTLCCGQDGEGRTGKYNWGIMGDRMLTDRTLRGIGLSSERCLMLYSW